MWSNALLGSAKPDFSIFTGEKMWSMSGDFEGAILIRQHWLEPIVILYGVCFGFHSWSVRPDGFMAGGGAEQSLAERAFQ